MPLIRYPGSKAKLVEQIYRRFPDEMVYPMLAQSAAWEYREPFFGAGAIGFGILGILSKRSRVWLNDVDPGVVSMWRSVLNHDTALRRKIAEFRPTAEAFFEFKAQDGAGDSEVEIGFRKLALHQMSVSGFGFKSGGPLGGKNQANANYPVGCRWNPQNLKRQVVSLHRELSKFSQIQITCGDFVPVLLDAPPECFTYLDPPYVEKGGQLYKHNMTLDDHRRLADTLQLLRCHWVLSYDDHAEVRRLYSWAAIEEVFVTYTNATNAKGARPKNREVVITRLHSPTPENCGRKTSSGASAASPVCRGGSSGGGSQVSQTCNPAGSIENRATSKADDPVPADS